MGYVLQPSITYTMIGGTLYPLQTFNTVAGNYSVGSIVLPDGLEDRVKEAYVDFIYGYMQNTFGGVNYLNSATGYIRIYDTVTTNEKTVYADMNNYLYANASGYYGGAILYGDTDIGADWLVDGRTYEVDLMNISCLQNNINIMNLQPVLRVVLNK